MNSLEEVGQEADTLRTELEQLYVRGLASSSAADWKKALADKTVNEARAEAHRLLSDARSEAELTTNTARREVEELTRQKDAVTTQLGQMLSGLAGIMPQVVPQQSDAGKKSGGKPNDSEKVSA